LVTTLCITLQAAAAKFLNSSFRRKPVRKRTQASRNNATFETNIQ